MKYITSLNNKKENCYVYCHIFPNGKRYIGITSLKPNYRWSNGNGYKSQKVIYRAIQKYGWENIKHEILYENLSYNDCKLKEIELIKEYGLTNISKGYNQTLGGDGTLGVKLSKERIEKMSLSKIGKPRSEEIRKKISESEKGKIISKEQIRRRSETMKKRYPSGFKQSDIVKIEMSKRMIDNKYNVGVHRNKEYKESISIKVKCVETNEMFKSIKSASEIKGVNFSNLYYVIRGIRKSAGGYHWERIDNY